MAEAYNLGIDAYNDGRERSENPYTKGTDDYFEWSEGWHAAQLDADEGDEEDD